MHLQVEKDLERAGLGCQLLTGSLIDLYKGIMFHKYLVKAIEDYWVKLWTVLEPYISCVVQIVEEELSKGRRLV